MKPDPYTLWTDQHTEYPEWTRAQKDWRKTALAELETVIYAWAAKWGNDSPAGDNFPGIQHIIRTELADEIQKEREQL